MAVTAAAVRDIFEYRNLLPAFLIPAAVTGICMSIWRHALGVVSSTLLIPTVAYMVIGAFYLLCSAAFLSGNLL